MFGRLLQTDGSTLEQCVSVFGLRLGETHPQPCFPTLQGRRLWQNLKQQRVEEPQLGTI